MADSRPLSAFLRSIRMTRASIVAASVLAMSLPAGARAVEAPRVTTSNGIVEGVAEPGGIRVFRAIPFAAAPVGDLRWKAPQPPKNWDGVRAAEKFGAQCMQRRVFGDMNFRASGMSEDCLFLNVWTPTKSASERLPVLVYYYGGGFLAGDGSEPRYDGEAMAKRGIVALTVNYRLGVFGFFAHAELTKESPQHASGNQGLLDQVAALQWVKQNIAAFGGDPSKVTIAGESAGSISVSVLMASPLSKGLIAGAIGESGAMIKPTLPAVPLADGEQAGVKFAAAVNAADLAALRAMPAAELLEATARPDIPRGAATIDGYLLPKPLVDIFTAGEQAKVPLLAGWNSEESNVRGLLGPKTEPTPENYAAAVRKRYGDRADEVLKLYPGKTPEEVQESGTALAGDQFIAFSTWKWIDLQAKTGGKPVYRYYYSHPRPPMRPEMGNAVPGLAGGVIRGEQAAAMPHPPTPRGAVHSADIEYAMGNLATNEVYDWTPDDYKVSETFLGYFANFIKTGDPNGPGLPKWPALNTGNGEQVMHIDVTSKAEPDTHRARYELLDSLFMK
jgi:para-nitrobenzyl esterase